MNLQGQDWDNVVIRKKQPKAADTRSSAAVNAAKRSGAEVASVKKFAAGANKTKHTTDLNTAKLDAETEELSHERVSSDLKKAIMQARLAKKMSQADLAKAINEKPQVIQEYESGKAIPNGQILNKLSRALGVTLSKRGPAKKK